MAIGLFFLCSSFVGVILRLLHVYRWLDYQNISPEEEAEHIARTVRVHEELLGKRPVGMYQGKPNQNTRTLVLREGGFLYDAGL